jgi:hypothetical protein
VDGRLLVKCFDRLGTRNRKERPEQRLHRVDRLGGTQRLDARGLTNFEGCHIGGDIEVDRRTGGGDGDAVASRERSVGLEVGEVRDDLIDRVPGCERRQQCRGPSLSSEIRRDHVGDSRRW